MNWEDNAPPPQPDDAWLLKLKGWIAAALLIATLLLAGRVIGWLD